MTRKKRGDAPPAEGPNPLFTLILLLLCILLLGLVFAAVKVFLIKQQTLPYEEGSITVTFCPSEDCAAHLAAEISNATAASCAFYDIDLPEAAAALRAVNATVLVDEDNAASAPLPVVSVRSTGLMHHKFCVLDSPHGPTVTAGSMNPTTNDARKNDNNLLVIRSATLARRYRTEFEELRSRSGSYRKRPAAPVTINVSGTVVEQRFCPQESCEETIVREIGHARQEIRFLTFTFTSDAIGAALADAAARGVNVSGVFERRQESEWSEYLRLRDAGLPVRLDGNPRTMHHKVFIIDGGTVSTGSYNPTRNGNEHNDENLLIIHDKEIARRFLEEFDRVWTQASPADDTG